MNNSLLQLLFNIDAIVDQFSPVSTSHQLKSLTCHNHLYKILHPLHSILHLLSIIHSLFLFYPLARFTDALKWSERTTLYRDGLELKEGARTQQQLARLQWPEQCRKCTVQPTVHCCSQPSDAHRELRRKREQHLAARASHANYSRHTQRINLIFQAFILHWHYPSRLF